MRYLKTIKQVLATVAEPLRRNCTFAVFMYLLGCITAWATLPNVRGAHLYDNLYLELFLDVYVLTLILTLLPRKVMIWVRGFFYVVLYATAVVDVYCFVKFQSTLTPTMLQLVGETDSRESGEFLRSCVSPDVLMSDVGAAIAVRARAHGTASTLSTLHSTPLARAYQVDMAAHLRATAPRTPHYRHSRAYAARMVGVLKRT